MLKCIKATRIFFSNIFHFLQQRPEFSMIGKVHVLSTNKLCLLILTCAYLIFCRNSLLNIEELKASLSIDRSSLWLLGKNSAIQNPTMQSCAMFLQLRNTGSSGVGFCLYGKIELLQRKNEVGS